MRKTNFPIYTMDMFKDQNQKEVPVIYQEIHGPKERELLHVNDFCRLLFVKSGGGSNIIDFVKYDLKPGQVHLIFPGMTHALALDPDAVVQELLITQRLLRVFIDQLKYAFVLYQKFPVIEMSEEGINNLAHSFLGMERELAAPNPNFTILNANTVISSEVINKEIFRQIQQIDYYKKPILFEFYSLVEVHYKEEKQPSFYAAKLNITTNYLNSLCIRHLTRTATSIIQEKIMSEAKKLLFLRDFSVKEVSIGLGFTDPSYFTRLFKSFTGITPKKYKKL
jgi:AraC-like DNA-binding protein